MQARNDNSVSHTRYLLIESGRTSENDSNPINNIKNKTPNFYLDDPKSLDTTYRMYAITRGDLNMTPGKAASQLGHAFKLLTRNCILEDP